MRRDELSYLYFSIKQGSNPLLGLSHDAKDNFVGHLLLILHAWIVQVLCDDQPLSRNEFPKLVRTSSERVLPISDFRTILVVNRLAGDREPIKEIFHKVVARVNIAS